VVGDDAGSLGGDEGLPAGIRRRAEAGDRVVELADEPGDAAEAAIGAEQAEVAWPGDGAGDEGEDFAAVLVQAQRPGCAAEPGRVQVAEQGVHRRGPRARRAAHGIADPDHAAAHVPPS
jgi:hypothetical protein